jgi:DeoR/GlpR family transcriptional regulator of sugar metabolism
MEKTLGLIPAERYLRIYEIIRLQGTVQVSSLSDLLGVSRLTIRRDLEHLENEGILERTHGGAIFTPHIQLEPLFTEKDRLNREEKQHIGEAAAAMMEDGDTVFINSGSTTLQIFRHLNEKKNLCLITSNMGAHREVRNHGIEVILVGGTYREQSNSLVGPLAIATLNQFNANKCFIGVDGVSLKYGLTTPALQEAEIARKMIERTRGKKIVIADHTKFGKVADAVTAPLEAVDILLVDSGFDESFRFDIEDLGIEIVVAPERY